MPSLLMFLPTTAQRKGDMTKSVRPAPSRLPHQEGEPSAIVNVLCSKGRNNMRDNNTKASKMAE